MKVKTDVTQNYFNATEALEDKWYTHIGEVWFNGTRRPAYEKNGNVYYFVSMDHFNSTVYSVTINNVKNLKSEYSIER